jgi:hypothetical protein
VAAIQPPIPLFAPFLAIAVTIGSQNDHQSYKDEDTGPDETVYVKVVVVVLCEVYTSDDDHDQPSGAAESVAQPDKDAEGYQYEFPFE